MSLVISFVCKFLLNILQCQLMKKCWIINCVPPEKQKLLGSAHAQRWYNASRTYGVQSGLLEVISYFMVFYTFNILMVDLVKCKR